MQNSPEARLVDPFQNLLVGKPQPLQIHQLFLNIICNMSYRNPPFCNIA